MKIDFQQLQNRCYASIDSFRSIGESIETPSGLLVSRCQADNKILAVAHLDSVQDEKHFYVTKAPKAGHRIFNTQLDDRLGVYILMDLLPRFGLKYDLLLTEGEEVGMSTAEYFETSKQYNWMFSFDRHGDDVVMYEYDTPESRERLKAHNLRPAYGAFSDICWLNHMKCLGFNFGTGYEHEHSPKAYVDTDKTISQVSKFINFFHAYENTLMPFSEIQAANFRMTQFKSWHDYSYTNDKFTHAIDDEFDAYDFCEICTTPLHGDDVDYGCCEDCAIAHGIYCSECSTRISIDDAINYGFCLKCDIG